MADERASITVALVDDASAGLDNLATKFRNLREQIESISGKGGEAFRKVKEESEKTKESVEKTGSAFKNFATFIRSGLVEFTIGFAKAQGALSGFETAMVSAVQVAARFGASLGGAAGVMARMGAGAGAVVAGIYLVARAMVDANQQAANLRTTLNESTDNYIKHAQRMGQAVGQTNEQTLGRMRTFAGQVLEMLKPGKTDMERTLGDFGNVGRQLGQKLREGVQKNMGTEEIYQKIFLPEVAKESEPVQRRIAARTGIDFAVLKGDIENLNKLPRPWEMNEEQRRKMREAEDRLATHLRSLQFMLSDNLTKAWFPWKLKITDALADLMREVAKLATNIAPALAAFFTEGVKVATAFLWTINKIVEGIKIIDAYIRSGSKPGTRDPRPEDERSRAFPEDNAARTRRRAGRRGAAGEAPPVAPPGTYDMNTPYEFGGGGGGGVSGSWKPDVEWLDKNLSGGFSTNVQDERGIVVQENMADESKEQTTYLREIRDVMTWLRDQVTGGGEGGGGGGGAGGAQFFSGGGGGGMGGGRAGLGGGIGGGGGMGGGGGGGGGGRGGGGGPQDTTQGGGLRSPTSPSEAPESLEAARAGGFMGAGGDGGSPLQPGKSGYVDKTALQDRLANLVESSGLKGLVPPDAARYGIKTGSAGEWASLLTNLAGGESSFRSTTHGDKGQFGGAGSRGLFQLSPNDALTYGLQNKPFTIAQLNDPDFNARMAVKIAEQRVRKGGIGGREGMAKYWAGPRGRLARGDYGVGRYGTAVREPTAGGGGETAGGGAGGGGISLADVKKSVGDTEAAVAGAGGAAAGAGGVIEMQGREARTRRGALSAETREQLEYAGGITGLNAEVFSGGQRMAGAPGAVGSHRHDRGGAADLRLRDPETGKLLDMRIPADRARMEAYTTAAVSAGATGVGAGGAGKYMGPHGIHIGGGTEKSWGGASWIERARRQGMQNRISAEQRRMAIAEAQRKRQARSGQNIPIPQTRPDKLGSADVTVDFKNMPKGVNAKAKGDGVFEDIQLKKSPQMAPAGYQQDLESAQE